VSVHLDRRVLIELTVGLAIAGFVVFVGACGDDDSDEETTPAPVVTDQQPPATPGGDGGAPAPDTAFRSPSGNISCIMSSAQVRCDIVERDWEPPPAPASCDLDWAQGLILPASGPADFICAGDTVLGEYAALAYGDSASVPPFTCVSEESGVTCENGEGSGFRLARESYAIFPGGPSG
jgi:hypothetical protein